MFPSSPSRRGATASPGARSAGCAPASASPSTPPSSTYIPGCSALGLIELLLHPLVELGDVHDHALVRAVPDQIPLIPGLDCEGDRSAFHARDTGGGDD